MMREIVQVSTRRLLPAYRHAPPGVTRACPDILDFPPAREILSPRKDTVTAGTRAPMDSPAAGGHRRLYQRPAVPGAEPKQALRNAVRLAIIGGKKPAADGGTAGGRSLCSLRKR